jgi:hypothetical protein
MKMKGVIIIVLLAFTFLVYFPTFCLSLTGRKMFTQIASKQDED